MAAPGAMSVIDWKSTSRRPIASRRRPGAGGAGLETVSPVLAMLSWSHGHFLMQP
jgi:hypothetical protein